MLNDPQLRKLTGDIVHGRLPAVELLRVLTEPTTDSEGNDALRITLVLTHEAVDSLTGEQTLKLLVDIQQAILGQGDERFPIIEYATEDDLREEELQEDAD